MASGFDGNEHRLEDVQRPDMYRAGLTLRSTFAPEEQIGHDLTSLMLELARVPAPGEGGPDVAGGRADAPDRPGGADRG